MPLYPYFSYSFIATSVYSVCVWFLPMRNTILIFSFQMILFDIILSHSSIVHLTLPYICLCIPSFNRSSFLSHCFVLSHSACIWSYVCVCAHMCLYLSICVCVCSCLFYLAPFSYVLCFWVFWPCIHCCFRHRTLLFCPQYFCLNFSYIAG